MVGGSNTRAWRRKSQRTHPSLALPTSRLRRRAGGNKLPDALGTCPLAIFNQHLPSHHSQDWETIEFPTIPKTVVAVRVQVRQRHRPFEIRIDYDDVSVAADRNDALTRIKTEQLGDGSRGHLYEPVDVEFPRLDSFGE